MTTGCRPKPTRRSMAPPRGKSAVRALKQAKNKGENVLREELQRVIEAALLSDAEPASYDKDTVTDKLKKVIKAYIKALK